MAMRHAARASFAILHLRPSHDMSSPPKLFQICLVVHNVRQANAHWARLLDRPEAPVEVIFQGGIVHHTHGQPTTSIARSPSTTSATWCWS
jgi:hypothetical protein